MKERRFRLDDNLSQALQAILQEYNFPPQQLARHILRLSDHFHSGAGPTPWESKELQAAYLAYFFPLNWIRLQAVLQQMRPHLESLPINSIIDFGSGAGTGHLVFADLAPRYHCVEISNEAKRLHQRLLGKLDMPAPEFSLGSPEADGTLAVFSYSFNELSSSPEWMEKCEHILLVEPSTYEASQKLLTLRQDFLAGGYFAWAPCTHQETCPLLGHKRDWCHDRVFADPPDWYLEIENELPMKNRSVTFSYLLVSRARPSANASRGRLIGDTLFEKGKVRQMVCRGPKREFLAWLTRDGKPDPLPRGEIVHIPETAAEVSNEIRLSANVRR